MRHGNNAYISTKFHNNLHNSFFYTPVIFVESKQGKPLADNSRSTRCGCKAMIRLLRTDDNGWYIVKMGDRNVDSYDVAMKKLMEIVPAIECQQSI